ncbi:MAG: hypothetical protein M3Y73_21420 [Actinomycetota bacterium]|nr:hypothetical protein [Actinomycetota bacterium]
MTVALVLMVGALLVAWVAPRRLERRLRGATDPQTTLVPGWRWSPAPCSAWWPPLA